MSMASYSVVFQQRFVFHLDLEKYLILVTESRRLQAPFQYAKDIHESVGSEVSKSVMEKWISDCCTFHQHVTPIRSLNPTRLIRLESCKESGARLYSPKHPVVFAALSYR
jgi:predicted GTPase